MPFTWYVPISEQNRLLFMNYRKIVDMPLKMWPSMLIFWHEYVLRRHLYGTKKRKVNAEFLVSIWIVITIYLLSAERRWF